MELPLNMATHIAMSCTSGNKVQYFLCWRLQSRQIRSICHSDWAGFAVW